MSEDLEPMEKVQPPCQIYYLQSSSGKVYRCYRTSEADKVIAEKDAEIAELKSDYKEACDRLQTANLIEVPIRQTSNADTLGICDHWVEET